MATRTATRPALSPNYLVHLHLFVLSILAGSAKTDPGCGAEFLDPQPGSTFFHLDTVNVSYASNLSDPTLRCFCGQILKFTTNPSPFSGSEPVLLDFTSPGPCWFELRSDTAACRGVDSPHFSVRPRPRHDLRTVRYAEPAARIDSRSPTNPRHAAPSNAADADREGHRGGGHRQGQEKDWSDRAGLNEGAKVGIAIAVAGVLVAIMGVLACLYLRRRRRRLATDSDVTGRLMQDPRHDHDQRGSGSIITDDAPPAKRKWRGRRSREKTSSGSGRGGAGERGAGGGRQQDHQLQVQPVLDGFPGSTGYEDVRSFESTTRLNSPAWSHSPTPSAANTFYTSDRDDLAAARIKSQSAASSAIVSYGPNPATPSSTSRPNLALGDPPRPHTPGATAPPPDSRPPKTTPAPAPMIVSYGPNRVTPTPVFASSTTPPDDDATLKGVPDLPAFLPSSPPPQHPQEQPLLPREPTPLAARQHQHHQHYQQQPHYQHQHHDQYQQQHRFHDQRRPSAVSHHDEPSRTPVLSALPLPPYAASTPEFYPLDDAGCLRTTRGPAPAAVELPPTKDGYYHVGDIDEYELPAPAPQREPQLPYRLYRNGPDGRGRELQEPKFLLSDVELAQLRQQKAAVRQHQQEQREQDEQQPKQQRRQAAGQVEVELHEMGRGR